MIKFFQTGEWRSKNKVNAVLPNNILKMPLKKRHLLPAYFLKRDLNMHLNGIDIISI